MVPFQEGVGPGTGTLQAPVLEDRWSVQHFFLLTVGFEAVVGQGPDTFLLSYLALALASAPTGAIALVFSALGFGAQIGDIGQGAVAAVAAIEGADL